MNDLRTFDPDAVTLERTGFDFASCVVVNDLGLQEPIITFGIQLNSDACGDWLVHLSHVAKLEPFRDGSFEP